MKKNGWRKFFVVLILVILTLVTGFSTAFANGNSPTAQEFMDSRMYPQAVALLNQQLNKNPKNAKAHYQLAICYLNQGNISAADQSFERALTLSPNFGLSIGKEYLAAGSWNLNRGNNHQAHQLIAKSLQYDPGLRDAVGETYRRGGENALQRNDLTAAKELYGKAISYNFNHRTPAMNACLDRGKVLLAAGEVKRAEDFFETALYFSSDAKERLCDIYFEQGRVAAKPSDFGLLERAKKYGSQHNEEILEIQIAKLPGETIRVEMGPNEVKDIADITPGQKWQYIYFRGDFSHRVTIGNTPPEIGDWKKVDNGLPWNAGQAGKLQTKSRSPSNFVVNIQ